MPMAFHRPINPKPKPRSQILFFTLAIAAIALLYLFSTLMSTSGFSFSSSSKTLNMVFNPNNRNGHERIHKGHEKYLYWGDRIDCPGKHCDSCEGLGHQESSLRCALEEAMFLKRTFVMPSRMCINPIHNKKGILHHSDNRSSEERWAASSCALDSLYDMDLISDTVPVILDNSKLWYQVLSTSMKLGPRGVAHVEGINRVDLKEDSHYSNLLLINRTASRLSWFMECKDRNNRSAIMLPYSFLPSMASKELRDAADKIKALLGDYDAIHVRRGDKIKNRKDRFGVERSLHPHLFTTSATKSMMDSECHTNVCDGNLDNSSDVELRLSNEVATVRSSHLAQTGDMSQNSSRAESTAVERDEPYVGQEFESEAAAHAFYNAYGMHMGFIPRVSNLSRSRLDKSIIGRTWVCNKEGYRVPDKHGTKIVRSRSPTRVGCKAMLSIKKLSTGEWFVTKFVKEHTHVLVPGKGRKSSIYNKFPNEHTRIQVQELTKQLLVERKRSASYREIIDILFKHIEDHAHYLSEKVQNIADCVKEIASEGKSVKSSNTPGNKL